MENSQEERLRFVRATEAEAVEFADFTSIGVDLDMVVGWLRLLPEVTRRATTAPPNDELLIGQGLWRAAVVTYARCFVSGVRMRLRDGALAGFTNEQRAAHGEFLLMRDKYFAHAVSPLDEVRVGLGVDRSGRLRRVLTAELNPLPDLAQINRLHWLAENVAQHVAREASGARERLIAEAERADDLQARADMTTTLPSTADLNQRRDAGR